MANASHQWFYDCLGCVEKCLNCFRSNEEQAEPQHRLKEPDGPELPEQLRLEEQYKLCGNTPPLFVTGVHRSL
jgi:hypothetical protein